MRVALDAFVAKTQELVTGEVRVRLQAGAPAIVGRRSEHALYAHALASYGVEDAFPHDASEGFIRLAAMEVELAAARERKLVARVTLWAGRVGGELAPECGSSCAATTRSCSRTTARRRSSTRSGCMRPGSSTTTSSRRWRRGSTRSSRPGPEDEDVHSAIERQLGEVGRKIHAGRSRNDQVAAALRLYVRAACARGRRVRSARFCAVVLDRAEVEAETPLPGYTHLQRAIPVTVGHHLLAWVEMLERDLARFAAADAAASPSPLGSGALAGSTLPLPPPDGEQTRNSLDAVADRDFALDYLYACAVLFAHLSRIGEELVLWSTSEFGFVRLPEEAATGSSMMPHKLNPDVAELVRGKAGTMIGRLTGLLAVVKGLPLAYDRDLQEDKPPVFAARRDVRLALGALAVLVDGLELDRARLALACADPLLRATDKAEDLVRSGVPFRAAHEQVAAEVRAGTFEPPEGAAARVSPGPGTSPRRSPPRGRASAPRAPARCRRRRGAARRSSRGTCRRTARRPRARHRPTRSRARAGCAACRRLRRCPRELLFPQAARVSTTRCRTRRRGGGR